MLLKRGIGMAKAKSKAELEQRIAELEEQLNTSNNAYNRLMQKYNELNQQKGDINGYNQLKWEHKRICELYEALQDSYAKEKKKMEQAPQQLNELKHKYNDLQAEHEQLQADYMELSNKYNAIIGTKREKGRPKKEVRANIDEIKERMNQGETAEQIANELGISRMTLFRRLKSNKNE